MMTTLSHIFKKGNVWYYSRGTGKNRFRVSLKTGSRRIAEERQRCIDQEYWLKQNCPGIYIQGILERNNITLDEVIKLIGAKGPGALKLTIKEGFDEWLGQLSFTSVANKKHKTNLINKIRGWMVELFPGLLVDELTFTHVNKWIKWMDEDRNYAKRTQQSNLIVLREFYSWATLEYDLKRNPTQEGVKTESLKSKPTDKPTIPGQLLFDTINSVCSDLYEKLHKEHPHYAFNSENARKDQIFWTLIAFTGANPIDAIAIKPEDFDGVTRRAKSGIQVKYCQVDQLTKFGADLYGVFKTRGQYSNSGKRFKVLTGYTFKAIRRFFLNELKDNLERRDLKAVAGHSEHSNVLDTNYLNANIENITVATQGLADKYQPLN